MNSSAVELFAHAAERAKDVAVMMDAARALTVLGRSKLCPPPADAEPGDGRTAWQVHALYQTAERLGQHVRQTSSEARTLLVTARQMLEAEPQSGAQLPADFAEVCQMMDEAMDRAIEAIDRLEQMRQAAAPAWPGSEAPAEVRETVQQLLQRLRTGPLAS